MNLELWNIGSDFFAALALSGRGDHPKAIVAAEAILYTLLTLDIIDCDAYSFWMRT